MSNMPNIPNTTIEVVYTNYWKITTNEGYVFWDRADYIDYETGMLREPAPEEIAYSIMCLCPQSIGVEAIEARIVVVPESDVPANQIFGNASDNKVNI
jgi:hypothetical protein